MACAIQSVAAWYNPPLTSSFASASSIPSSVAIILFLITLLPKVDDLQRLFHLWRFLLFGLAQLLEVVSDVLHAMGQVRLLRLAALLSVDGLSSFEPGALSHGR